MTAPELQVRAVHWPDVGAGDDLVALILRSTRLEDGDILVLTSKVVSKAERRTARGDRHLLVADETVRVVARRGSLVIAETRQGLVLAAAGVDASNTEPGTSLALPLDPDRTARSVRAELSTRARVNVGVIVSDTAGRPWRLGQTDIAIGCAGLAPLTSLAGRTDPYGNELVVTAPALADELAAAGDLVKGKTSGCPLAVVRGLAELVLPSGQDGPGAGALIRPGPDDLFALGARDAAVAAAHRDTEALASFPPLTADDADPFDGLTAPDGVHLAVSPDADAAGRRTWTVEIAVAAAAEPNVWVAAGMLVERVRTLAAAHRLTPTAVDHRPERAGLTAVDRTGWITS